MKSLSVVVILGAIIYVAFRFGPSLIQGSYESIEYGIKFNYPSALITQELALENKLEIRKAGTSNNSPHVFFQKYRHDDGQVLSYRIPREFGEAMMNEKDATYNGIRGLSFNWQGPQGLESAFAFQSSDRDYVVTTYGMPNDEARSWFDGILASLIVTYK